MIPSAAEIRDAIEYHKKRALAEQSAAMELQAQYQRHREKADHHWRELSILADGNPEKCAAVVERIKSGPAEHGGK